MAYDPADEVYVEADTHPDATTPDGVLVVKVNGPLFFADAAPFRASLLNLVSANDATTVVVDLEATPAIDLDGADMLTKVHEQLADRGVRLLLTHADTTELDLLRRAGTLDAIGEENIFETVRAAVAAATPVADVTERRRNDTCRATKEPAPHPERPTFRRIDRQGTTDEPGALRHRERSVRHVAVRFRRREDPRCPHARAGEPHAPPGLRAPD